MLVKIKKVIDRIYDYIYIGSIFLTAYISILSLLRHNYVSFKYSVLAFVAVYLLDKYKRCKHLEKKTKSLIEDCKIDLDKLEINNLKAIIEGNKVIIKANEILIKQLENEIKWLKEEKETIVKDTVKDFVKFTKDFINENVEEPPIEYNMRQIREMYSKQIEKNAIKEYRDGIRSNREK